jgi:hypothetical protein
MAEVVLGASLVDLVPWSSAHPDLRLIADRPEWVAER